MVTYLKGNIQFLFIISIWLVGGILLKQSEYLLIPLSLLVFINRYLYAEILIGFWFLLIVSDSRWDTLEFAKSLKNIYIVAMGLIVLLKRREIMLQPNQIFKFLLPFLILSLFLVFRSDTPSVSFQKVLSYSLIVFVTPHFVQYLIKKDELNFYRKFVQFGIFVLLIGFALRFIDSDLALLDGRFKGMMGNPNGLGIFSMVLLFLFESMNKKRPDAFGKVERRFYLGIIIVSLILSQTRSAIFAVILYYVFARVYHLSGYIGFISFLVFVLLYQQFLELVPSMIKSFGLGKFFRMETLAEGSGRFVAWDFARSNIQDNFFLGKGFNYTEELFSKNYPMLSRQGHQGNAHNSFLTLWLDTGLVGLICYLGAFAGLAIKAAKNYRISMPILYAIVFAINFESWLAGSLNPFTIIFIFTMVILLTPPEDVEATAIRNDQNK